MHHSAKFWPDPERFDPERFTPERSAGRPKLTYLPFGTGQRMCIGNGFALMKAQACPCQPAPAWSPIRR